MVGAQGVQTFHFTVNLGTQATLVIVRDVVVVVVVVVVVGCWLLAVEPWRTSNAGCR